MIAAVASATPSRMPIVTIELPSAVAMKTGSKLWISSDEMSINIEPNPNAQTAGGRSRHGAGAKGEKRARFERGRSMAMLASLPHCGGQFNLRQFGEHLVDWPRF